MSDSKGWVSARANCTVEVAARAIHAAIKSDIEEFNDLPTEKRGCRTFKIDDRDYTNVGIGFNVDNRHIAGAPRTYWALTFKVNKNNINVFINDAKEQKESLLFPIEIQWCEETSLCQYLADEQPVTPEEISRKALYPVFFK